MKYDNLPAGESLTYRELFQLAPMSLVRNEEDSGTISDPLQSGGRHIVWDDGCHSSIPASKADSVKRSGVWQC